jgi:hypothetical protein
LHWVRDRHKCSVTGQALRLGAFCRKRHEDHGRPHSGGHTRAPSKIHGAECLSRDKFLFTAEEW